MLTGIAVGVAVLMRRGSFHGVWSKHADRDGDWTADAERLVVAATADRDCRKYPQNGRCDPCGPRQALVDMGVLS